MSTLYPYSSLLIELPPLLRTTILAFAEAIPEDELVPPGRELYPHVTVLDGLHAEWPDEVRPVVEAERPLGLRFENTSVFPANSTGREYDILKVDIESEAILRLHDRLASQLPHTMTNPCYVPHVTIAFVRPGAGARYAGWPILAGHGMLVERLIFSSRDAHCTEIPLRGRLRAAPAARHPLASPVFNHGMPPGSSSHRPIRLT